MNKENLLSLADEYAHCYAYVGDPSISTTRAALVVALDAADAEIGRLNAGWYKANKATLYKAVECVALKAENAKLRLDAERYRAIRKATLTEDDAFMDALDDAGTPKTDAQFDSAFDAAINAARAALDNK